MLQPSNKAESLTASTPTNLQYPRNNTTKESLFPVGLATYE